MNKSLVILAMFLIFFIFLPVNIYAYYTTEIENGTITIMNKEDILEYWNPYESEKLVNWNDFEGEIPEETEDAAYTTTWITHEYGIKSLKDVDCKFIFLPNISSTTAFFDKKLSWVKLGEKTDEILYHEHGHFHIAQIYAQKLALELTYLEPKIFSCSGETDELKAQSMRKNSKIVVQEITDEIFHMRDFTDKNYDYEINSPNRDFQQKRWDHVFETMLADPSLSLAEAKLLIPEKPTNIIINKSKPICDFFVFADRCTVSVNTQLLINFLLAFIVAGLVAAYFYLRHKKDAGRMERVVTDMNGVMTDINDILTDIQESKNKRKEFAEESFIISFDFIKMILKDARKIQPDFYQKKDGSEKTVEDVNRRFALAGEHIRFMLGISADVLDRDEVKDIDFLCAILEKPVLQGEEVQDSQQLKTIENIMNNLTQGPLKAAKAKWEKQKAESRKKYGSMDAVLVHEEDKILCINCGEPRYKHKECDYHKDLGGPCDCPKFESK